MDQIQFLLGHVSVQTPERYFAYKTGFRTGGYRMRESPIKINLQCEAPAFDSVARTGQSLGGRTRDVVEYSMIAIMLGGVIGGLLNRYLTGRGIGERFTQFIVFVLTIPAVVILALERLIGPETTATILGVAIGFAASVAGRDLVGGKKKQKQPPSEQI